MDKEKLEPIITPDEYVKVTEMGSIIELQSSNVRGIGGKTKRIDSEHYINTETGEVKKYKKKNPQSRYANYQSLSRSFKRAKELIYTNFKTPDRTAWITLTFYEPVSDAKEFDKYFKSFLKQLKRRNPKNSYKYIVAIEFCADKTLHCHCLIFWEKSNYIIKDSFWKKGRMFIRNLNAISDIRNIGAYLTSYLTNMTIEEYQELHPEINIPKEKIKEIKTFSDDDSIILKRFVKNARLELYPPGFKIIRHSTNMEEPINYYKKYSKISSELKDSYNLAYTGEYNFNASTGIAVAQKYEYYEEK